MLRGSETGARRGAARAIPVLAVAACALAAAAAYATTRLLGRQVSEVRTVARPVSRLSPAATESVPGPRASASRRGVARPGRPRISGHPEPLATVATARFAFTATGATSFQCRLDGSSWSPCGSPRLYSGLATGGHGFSVRGLLRQAPRRRAGASVANLPVRHARRPLVAGPAVEFAWRVVEPKPFSIQPQLGSLQPLLPGAPAQSLAVVVSNPNEVPIFVTAVGARATAGPAGCDGAANLELLPAGVSAAAPLTVPAGGSVSLPAPGVAAPSISLRDLDAAQDACEGGSFQLEFEGAARG